MSGTFQDEQLGIQRRASGSRAPYTYMEDSLASESVVLPSNSYHDWHSRNLDKNIPPPPYYEQWQSWGTSNYVVPYGEYVSIDQLMGTILQRRVLLPIFLVIFSLSRNFEHALDALKAQCNVAPTEYIESQVCVLLALNCFVTRLWLNIEQYRKLEQFIPVILTPNPRPAVEYALWVLDESLRKSKSANIGSPEDSLAWYFGNVDFKLLASKLAKTLATLESQLRQDDPVGECVRWLAKGRDRDFLSFHERVRHWILRSVLSEVKPIDVKRCYQLFYEVAKQSKQINNFSAARAIASSLIDLNMLRSELSIDASEINNLTDLDHKRLDKVKSANQPFLLHIGDVLSKARINAQAVDIVSGSGVHWNKCQELHYDLQGFVSHPDCQLLPPQRYVFPEDQVFDFVRKDLIKYEPFASIPSSIQTAIKRYKKATQSKLFVSRSSTGRH